MIIKLFFFLDLMIKQEQSNHIYCFLSELFIFKNAFIYAYTSTKCLEEYCSVLRIKDFQVLHNFFQHLKV